MKAYQFSLLGLLGVMTLVAIGAYVASSIRDTLKAEPFKQQPAFHWGENHAPRK